MACKPYLGEKFNELVDDLLASYHADPRTHRIGKRFLPSRPEIIEVVQVLLEIVYPGLHGRQDLTEQNLHDHIQARMEELTEKLHRQIHNCLCYDREARGDVRPEGRPDACDQKALGIAIEFLERLPAIRGMLSGDVQAAYDGDPAATGTDEIILAYPGVLAVTVYRLAHELHIQGVPLMPRIMTEWVHSVTGCDIHPGARIGRSFFIDHASGVVIGETTVIGDNVKMYQGVTLGALSFAKDERGRLIRGTKRHPTIENNVVIYANATVLGGETVVGTGSEVGGSVFLTKSVPGDSVVKMKSPELRFRSKLPPSPTGEDKAVESAPEPVNGVTPVEDATPGDSIPAPTPGELASPE
jgi:serine O-acetyltransferase